MSTLRSLFVGTTIILLAAAAPADAQFLQAFDETLWGVQASLTSDLFAAVPLLCVFQFGFLYMGLVSLLQQPRPGRAGVPGARSAMAGVAGKRRGASLA